MSAPDSDKGHNPTHHKATTQTATFQMEIPSKVALVKPAENKTSTIQSNQTIRYHESNSVYSFNNSVFVVYLL